MTMEDVYISVIDAMERMIVATILMRRIAKNVMFALLV